MIKISVIIPVYNAEHYLQKCLNSICNQTLQDIEIICINDSSTDNSLDILNEYAKNDNRIKIINFTQNQGASGARNTAIKEAKGEYIGFVDSDDFIDLDFYEKLYTKAYETNADATKGSLTFSTQNTERDVFYDINTDIQKNIAYFYHSFTTAIYKTDFIRKNNIYFPENITHFEDPYFSIKAGLYYEKVAIVKDTYYHYEDNENSLTKSLTEQHINSVTLSIRNILNMLNEADITPTHYTIVYGFLIRQLLPLCNQNLSNINLNKKSIEALVYLYTNCKYKEQAIEYHLKQNQNIQKKVALKKLHTNIKKHHNS